MLANSLIVASNDLYIENEVRVGRNARLGACAVTCCSGAAKVSLLADRHLSDGGLPALDHGVATNRKGDRLASRNRGIKDRSVRGERASVLDLGLLSIQALIAGTLRKYVNGDAVVNLHLRKILAAFIAFLRSRGLFQASFFTDLGQVHILKIVFEGSEMDGLSHGD